MASCSSSVAPQMLMSPDNAGNLRMGGRTLADIICPHDVQCVDDVAPYFIIWKTSKAMENDALNQFLASWFLSNEWAQRSGVCTNMYVDVIRHDPAGSTNSGAETILLQTNCSDRCNAHTGEFLLVGGILPQPLGQSGRSGEELE
ncbi:unnamed protein product [Calypogeia fissa]